MLYDKGSCLCCSPLTSLCDGLTNHYLAEMGPKFPLMYLLFNQAKILI